METQRFRRLLAITLGVVFLASAATTVAQVELRFSPQETTLATGAPCRLSILLDQERDVRSFEVRIEYEGAPSHTSVDDFLQWCEDQYPASMSVDKEVDFEVHRHAVDVLDL